MHDVVNGLAANNHKSLGDEVSARLLTGSFNHISDDLSNTKQELKETKLKLDTVSQSEHSWKEKALVLKEKVRANTCIRK